MFFVNILVSMCGGFGASACPCGRLTVVELERFPRASLTRRATAVIHHSPDLALLLQLRSLHESFNIFIVFLVGFKLC